jgi:hypothetical protein
VDLEVVVEGVPDAKVENEIKRHVRRVCKGAASAGQWSVTLSPSETRGQWDLGVRGPSRRYFVSFAERVDRFPELVAGQLQECLVDSPPTAPATRTARSRPVEKRE